MIDNFLDNRTKPALKVQTHRIPGFSNENVKGYGDDTEERFFFVAVVVVIAVDTTRSVRRNLTHTMTGEQAESNCMESTSIRLRRRQQESGKVVGVVDP